jgi:hypothetical protein
MPMFDDTNSVMDHDPLDLSAAQEQTIREIVFASTAQVVRAGHVYDRHGHAEIDGFANRPNPAYRRPNDDIVVQVNIVIGAWQRDEYEALMAIYASQQHEASVREHRIREAAVSEAAATLAAAQARLDEAKKAVEAASNLGS